MITKERIADFDEAQKKVNRGDFTLPDGWPEDSTETQKVCASISTGQICEWKVKQRQMSRRLLKDPRGSGPFRGGRLLISLQIFLVVHVLSA